MAKEHIVTSIIHLVNQSFNEGKFINEWKSAKVIPLHKKGDVNDVRNYRPISVLSTSFYFRGGPRFTYSSMALCLDIGQIVCAIYLDSKRAFDTVAIFIFLCKLRAVGCSEKALLWFKSYLCDRSQNVNFNNFFSDTRTTFAGVPHQGSKLGTLLFLIMINDLPNVLKHCKLTMYADDTTLYVCGVDNRVLQGKIQEDLDRISVWLAQNKLRLNIDKTHFMILGTQQRIKAHDNGINPISLQFNGSALSRVRNTKCLGVIILMRIIMARTHWFSL